MRFMQEWLKNMAIEVNKIKRAERLTANKAIPSTILVYKRLIRLEATEEEVSDTHNMSANESHTHSLLEKTNHIWQEIKKKRMAKSWGRSKIWLLSVFMLVCKLLCDGVHSDQSRATIQTASSYFSGAESKYMLPLSIIRESRTVVQITNELISAYTLARQKHWN